MSQCSLLHECSLGLDAPAWLVESKQASELMSQPGMLDESGMSVGVPMWLVGWHQAKHWCPGLASWVNAG